jgi:signal transduction histidine kinase
VKYGPAGQTITVRTAAVTEAGTWDGGRVRFWVEDEGPGIPATDRDRVWEPYVRLNRRAESATGGSGIGLSVVRELVTMHGGRTWAEAAEGGGARLIVELPRILPNASKPPAAAVPPRHPASV